MPFKKVDVKKIIEDMREEDAEFDEIYGELEEYMSGHITMLELLAGRKPSDESLKESVKEMMDMREGKIHKRNCREVFKDA